ncbi:MAG: ABC transporter ATP-binding protein [Lachnospiraceae bacterium]
MSSFIEVNNLKKFFPTPRGLLHAVDGVNFKIEQGTTLGVVGESGCGKTTLGRVMVHLEDSTAGQILFDGRDVTKLKGKKLKNFHNEMRIIFQDPYSSLNPRLTVEQSIQEPLRTAGLPAKFIAERTETLMNMVGIDERLRKAYPHELDGGRRQRVGIARALAPDPKFIVCDEPVSALDVSIQAQVLNLLQDLQREHGLTYMFITHDLSVVRHISHNIAVMYLGQLVETSPSKELFKNPAHPYTKALLSAIPSLDITKEPEHIILKGEITSPVNPKPGCRFAQRCPYTTEKCHEPQHLEEIAPNHFVACCRVKELN